jgi:[ribosomal protein S18]-alanine N-acetyltransferase
VAGKELNCVLTSAMELRDLPQILEIEKSSFTTPWSEALFSSEISNGASVCRVAKLNGRVVGYLCGQIIIDEGHILDLAVHPEQRSRGIASLLIQEMTGIMRDHGCRSVFLEVRFSNEQARSIYRKFGFALLGRRKNYYVSPAEDAIILVLRLAGQIPAKSPL